MNEAKQNMDSTIETKVESIHLYTTMILFTYMHRHVTNVHLLVKIACLFDVYRDVEQISHSWKVVPHTLLNSFFLRLG